MLPTVFWDSASGGGSQIVAETVQGALVALARSVMAVSERLGRLSMTKPRDGHRDDQIGVAADHRPELMPEEVHGGIRIQVERKPECGFRIVVAPIVIGKRLHQAGFAPAGPERSMDVALDIPESVDAIRSTRLSRRPRTPSASLAVSSDASSSRRPANCRDRRRWIASRPG
jgi:hypothetical protein